MKAAKLIGRDQRKDLKKFGIEGKKRGREKISWKERVSPFLFCDFVLCGGMN